MGVHICIVDERRSDVPEWDYSRYAGDTEIALAIGNTLPVVDDQNECVRPVDMAAWKLAASQYDGPNGRLSQMIGLFENNPSYRIRLSW